MNEEEILQAKQKSQNRQSSLHLNGQANGAADRQDHDYLHREPHHELNPILHKESHHELNPISHEEPHHELGYDSYKNQQLDQTPSSHTNQQSAQTSSSYENQQPAQTPSPNENQPLNSYNSQPSDLTSDSYNSQYSGPDYAAGFNSTPFQNSDFNHESRQANNPTTSNEPPKDTKPGERRTFRQKTFSLRYVIMWISGLIFIPLLIYVFAAIFQAIFDPAALISASTFDIVDSGAIISVKPLAAMIIFGIAHIVLSASCIKDLKERPVPKYVTVLSVIYVSIFAIVALIYLWLAVSGLIEALISDAVTDNSELSIQLTTSFVAILLLTISSLEQLRTIHHIKPQIFTVTLSAIAVIGAILYCVIPVARARDIAYDDKIEDDLYDIQDAIEDYVYDYDSLPELQELNFSPTLNNSINNYTLNKISEDYESITYELCATFKINTMADNYYDYSYYTFSYHYSGDYCFTEVADRDWYYVYDDLDYDDYDYYYNIETDSDSNDDSDELPESPELVE